VVVFTLVSTFPNRKVKSGVGKIAEEELVSMNIMDIMCFIQSHLVIVELFRLWEPRCCG